MTTIKIATTMEMLQKADDILFCGCMTSDEVSEDCKPFQASLTVVSHLIDYEREAIETEKPQLDIKAVRGMLSAMNIGFCDCADAINDGICECLDVSDYRA